MKIVNLSRVRWRVMSVISDNPKSKIQNPKWAECD
jgi:hypothetical protein